MPPTRTARARLVALAVGLVVVTLSPLLGAQPTGAETTPGPCPFDPVLAFDGTLSNGNVRIGRAAATGATASFCGIFSNSLPGQLYQGPIEPSHIGFATVPATVDRSRVSITLSPTAPLQATLAGPAFPLPGAFMIAGSYNVRITRLGFTCLSGPVSVTLTTQPNGQLTGQRLTPVGNGSRGTGRVVANDFAVPAVASSSTCPAPIARSVNRLLGLPSPAGGSSLTFDVEMGQRV
jgi:hypothetical protein